MIKATWISSLGSGEMYPDYWYSKAFMKMELLEKELAGDRNGTLSDERRPSIHLSAKWSLFCSFRLLWPGDSTACSEILLLISILGLVHLFSKSRRLVTAALKAFFVLLIWPHSFISMHEADCAMQTTHYVLVCTRITPLHWFWNRGKEKHWCEVSRTNLDELYIVVVQLS